MMKWLKIFGVVFGALLITALGIDAADTAGGSRTTLLGQLISAKDTSGCPPGMISITTGETFSCVDMFEVSASDKCPHPDPANEIETKENIDAKDCIGIAQKGRLPWRYITREQAVIACMKAGKRLPKSDEWYTVAVGTPDDPQKCNINSSNVLTSGAQQDCVSASGIYDAIGNVWEWTIDDVIQGQFQGRPLPDTGYVTQVDSHGVATLTGSQPSKLFYDDYFWSTKEGAFGILRGGFYGSGADAGVYSVHADTVPTSNGTAIGFRCVK